MKKIIALLLLVPSIALFAQKTNNPASYAKTITAADLQKNLYTIAGKEMEGRETATPGQKKAAIYIENYFKSLGLQPGNKGSYQMTFPVYRDEVTKSLLEINGTEYKVNTEYQPYTFTNYNTSQYFSEVVFAGHGIADSSFNDYKDLNVAGKLVLIMDGLPTAYQPKGSPPSAGIFSKIIYAQRKGAAGVLIVSSNFPRSPRPTGTMYRELYRGSQYLPTWYVSEKVAEVIMGNTDWLNIKEDYKTDQLPSKIYASNVHLEFEKNIQKLESSNVLGFMEGTDLKDEYVFLTAHYDHLGQMGDGTYFPGANDNASGTSMVLNLVKYFSQHPSKYSVAFICFTGEELGLLGSTYFVQHPQFPIDKIKFLVNLDIVGTGDEGIKVVNATEFPKQFDQLVKLNDEHQYLRTVSPRGKAANSDHYPFYVNGVPCFFIYTMGGIAAYHDVYDRAETLPLTDYEDLFKLLIDFEKSLE